MNDSRPPPSRHAADGAPPERMDLGKLVARMLEDMVRIAEAQGKLFDVNLTSALSHAMDHAIDRAVGAILCLLGGLSLLCAMIALLHRYFLWWEALGISGVIMVAAGWIVQRVSLSRAAKQASDSEQA
jgi:hypothetical protein